MFLTGYDNERRTLGEIRELAREAALEALEKLHLDLVFNTHGKAVKEIDVVIRIKEH